ncbi:type I 3-dehydroquinase-domain-containing protein, partial [Syncephalis pseudoplumigaleata]
GVDAVELRVDLLDYPGKGGDEADIHVEEVEDTLLRQLTQLRRATTLPIIYTVRTAGQGGQFPDGHTRLYEQLCEFGFRAGCDYVDIELPASNLTPSVMAMRLARRVGHTRIIASYHDVAGRLWTAASPTEGFSVFREIIAKLAQYGSIVKLISMATDIADNFALHTWSKHDEIVRLLNGRPLITMNMGDTGRLSRVLNRTLTPVTHPALPVRAAPGQLSVREIHTLRHQLGMLPRREFYLLGSPIQSSPSPLLHNTGFDALGLPHHYALREMASVRGNEEAIRAMLASDHFGGASVTIPLKVDIIALLDEISPSARAIGAVNTIIRRADGSSYGDNTDWLGILHSVKRQPCKLAPSSGAALIIGAGGTARAAIYAAHRLGIARIYLYNRTRANAEQLVQQFNTLPITIVDSLDDVAKAAADARLTLQLIISTVPGTITNMTLPSTLFAASGAQTGGVAVELAYRPRETALMAAAAQHAGWCCVPGVDVLIGQGLWQFRYWTGCKPPQ